MTYLLLALLLGQTPDTQIIAPTKPVRRGKNIVIAVAPVAEKPKGLVSYSFIWVINPPVDDLFTYPDNSKGSFGSGDSTDPNRYEITLVANYLFTDEQGKNPVLKTVQRSVTVTVTDGDLAQFVNATVKNAGLPAAEAQKLAGAFRGLIFQHAGVPFKSKAELVTATVAADRAALGSNLGNWVPTLDLLAKKLDTLQITAVDDIITTYGEIATGLEGVR